MDSNLFDEYWKQMKDLQQQVVKAAIGSFPGGIDQNNPFGTWDTALNLQKDLVDAAIKTQETGINMALSAQQNMCSNYFQLLRSSFRLESKS